jgi:pimeloyl-ACP methyl ester carboxylesterase
MLLLFFMMRLMTDIVNTPAAEIAYSPRRPGASHFTPVRNQRYHHLAWGVPLTDTTLPPVVLLHGWMDVGASFQFVVDAFSDDFLKGRTVLAPDWRGYGQSTGAPTDNFWFADYMADLDAWLDALGITQAIHLVGHSMGGNVAMMYAGVRPQRIAKLVNLEGFGMPRTKPMQAPSRYARWMDELKAQRAGELDLKSYDSAAGVARRLMKTNPRLRADRAAWLATQWAKPDAQGNWHIQGESGHKVVNAHLYQADEAMATFARITAPTLVVVAEHSRADMAMWWKDTYSLEEFKDRMKAVPQLEHADMPGAGHMLHHDQPEALAGMLQRFLAL